MAVLTELIERSNTNPKRREASIPHWRRGSLEEGSERGRQCLTMILKDELKKNPPSVQRKKKGGPLHKKAAGTQKRRRLTQQSARRNAHRPTDHSSLHPHPLLFQMLNKTGRYKVSCSLGCQSRSFQREDLLLRPPLQRASGKGTGQPALPIRSSDTVTTLLKTAPPHCPYGPPHPVFCFLGNMYYT